jgi:signal transduction histidine kinase
MRRLSGELHDGAVQELLVAGYDLVELTETADLGADAQALVERVASRIDEAYDQLRRVLTEMSREDDPTDPDLSLVDALRACAAGPLVPAGVRVDVLGPDGPEPAGAARDVAIRAVREGLINVRKHAGATRVVVSVRRSRRWWKVDVDDDGNGDEHLLRGLLRVRRPQSYGLPSIASDASMVGGRLWIGVSPELGGIRVSTSVPTRRS